MMSRARRPLLVVLITGVLAACAGPIPEGPVPDDALFDAISGLHGVVDSSVTYQDDFGNGAMYSGAVTVEPGADARCVLYQVVAVLEQGREGASLGDVSVTGTGSPLGARDLPTATRRALADASASPTGTPEVPSCSGVDLGGAEGEPTASPTP